MSSRCTSGGINYGGLCGVMSAQQFFNEELANGVPVADILADLSFSPTGISPTPTQVQVVSSGITNLSVSNAAGTLPRTQHGWPPARGSQCPFESVADPDEAARFGIG